MTKIISEICNIQLSKPTKVKPKKKPKKVYLISTRSYQPLKLNIDKYFEDCDNTDKLYSVSGFAKALGFNSRKDLVEYKGERRVNQHIKKALLTIEEQMEQRLIQGKGNVVGTIFNLKNNFNWLDRTDVGMALSQSGPIIIEVNGFDKGKAEKKK